MTKRKRDQPTSDEPVSEALPKLLFDAPAEHGERIRWLVGEAFEHVQRMVVESMAMAVTDAHGSLSGALDLLLEADGPQDRLVEAMRLHVAEDIATWLVAEMVAGAGGWDRLSKDVRAKLFTLVVIRSMRVYANRTEIVNIASQAMYDLMRIGIEESPEPPDGKPPVRNIPPELVKLDPMHGHA